VSKPSSIPMSHHSHPTDSSLAEATQRWWQALAAGDALNPLPAELVRLHQANNRITAEPIWALMDSPHYRAAAMDGYAVRAAATLDAQPNAPLRLALGETAYRVDTGDLVPDVYDAVIMCEAVHLLTESEPPHIEIVKAATPGQHIRPIGEDMQIGQLILPANHRLRPVDIGAAAGAGHTGLWVRRQPRIAILPTGSELVAPGSAMQPGDIVEYNSLMLAAAAQEWGAVVTRLPPIADDLDAIRTAVAAALPLHDLVVVNAGSSAGREDYTAAVFGQLGQIVVQGIAMRPGHPTILAFADLTLETAGARSTVRKALAGIPGYPVSAVITFEQLIQPLIRLWQGQSAAEPLRLAATLAQSIHSQPGQDEFLRVSLAQVGTRLWAIPLPRHAGAVMSLVRADGMLHLPPDNGGYAAGETVLVDLRADTQQFYNTIVVAGEPSPVLTVLSDQLRQQQPTLRLIMLPTDESGAWLALQQAKAHLAVCYLRDTGEGEYNLPSIRLVWPEFTGEVVRLAQQGSGWLDWVVPATQAGDAKIQTLLAVARSREFKRQLGAKDTYTVDQIGVI